MFSNRAKPGTKRTNIYERLLRIQHYDIDAMKLVFFATKMIGGKIEGEIRSFA
jgi:hypothetical protein